MNARIVGTALVLVACGNGSQDTVSPSVFGDGIVAIVADVAAAGWPRDQLVVTSAVVTGDTLRLSVRYGGGCATHRVALLISGAFMESFPVQVHARLAHDAAGDTCRALITRELTFDLTPLKQRYRASYGGGSATIVIHLTDQSRSLRYSFD